MKKNTLEQIIKEEFNKILAEAKMFDDPSELISGVDAFLDDLYVNKTTKWQATLRNIIDQDTGFLNIVNQVLSLVEIIEKELNILNDFDKDIRMYTQEYDEVYQKSGELSPQDNKIYDELEDANYKLVKTGDQIEEYISTLKEIIEHYEGLEYTLGSLLRYRFKS